MLPETEQWTDLVLVDGTQFHGRLGSVSTQLDETLDRDLLLVAPIKVRSSRDHEWSALGHAGTLVVSAARISYFTIQYVTKVAGVQTEPEAGQEPTSAPKNVKSETAALIEASP